MTEHNNLISVIVPVYNVELYLAECINSILKQSFSNFELLLIDDGSTDHSSLICQEYVLKDSRIKYYKKSNGGLSDARNYGIKKSIGKYITFIDSDDYIDENYLKILFDSLISNNADISIANYRRIDELGNISYDLLPGKKMILSPIEAMEYILYQKYISISVTAKLYKANLFCKINFPYGKLYEDIITLPQLIFNSDKIVYLPDVLLNYRIRTGSITESNFKEKDMDMLYNALDILKYVKEHNFSSLIKPIQSYIYSKCSTLVILISKTNVKNNKKYLYFVWKYIRKYRIKVLLDTKARKLNRLGSLVSFFGYRVYIFIYNLFKKR